MLEIEQLAWSSRVGPLPKIDNRKIDDQGIAVWLRLFVG